MSETIKNSSFSGSMFIYHRVHIYIYIYISQRTVHILHLFLQLETWGLVLLQSTPWLAVEQFLGNKKPIPLWVSGYQGVPGQPYDAIILSYEVICDLWWTCKTGDMLQKRDIGFGQESLICFNPQSGEVCNYCNYPHAVLMLSHQ